jgi:signal transduction histidine kinase
VREIASELRLPELEDHGLLAALKWHARDFERRTRVKCIIATPDDLREPEGLVAVVLFRIFQEAMTNIMRHANASEVHVSLERRATMILLRVRDNGIGIAPTVARSRYPIGLKGMRERAAIVKGRVMVCSLRPRGTLVSVRIPVIAEYNEFSHRV